VLIGIDNYKPCSIKKCPKVIESKDTPHPQKYSYPIIAKNIQTHDIISGGANTKLSITLLAFCEITSSESKLTKQLMTAITIMDWIRGRDSFRPIKLWSPLIAPKPIMI